MTTSELKRVRPASIDSPAQAGLYLARQMAKDVSARLRDLRQQLKDEPLGGNRASIRLEIDDKKLQLMDLRRSELEAKRVLERRARELGQTIGVEL